MPHSEFLDFALTEVLHIIQQTNDRLVQVMVIAQNTRGCPKYLTAVDLTDSRSDFGATSWLRIQSAELLASTVDGKHPLDARLLGITPSLPGGDLCDERRFVGDPAIETLRDHYADLDRDLC